MYLDICSIWGNAFNLNTPFISSQKLLYEKDGDARRKLCIKQIKENNLGVART